MKWIPDSTGRFKWRPYYDRQELDNECQRLVTDFLKKKYGYARFPVSTDDLSVMIEQETSDLDLYADLSLEGGDVEGLTEFFPDRKPAVKIAGDLSLDGSRVTRLRSTLAHEYGHVRFHSFLWDLEIEKQSSGKVLSKTGKHHRMSQYFRGNALSRYSQTDYRPHVILLKSYRTDMTFRCTGSSIIDAPYSDWMEWQASYVCGAVLMPLSQIGGLISTGKESIIPEWLPAESDSAQALVARVAESFDVSPGAARIRLQKLGFLQNVPSHGIAAGLPSAV
jgi:hypothetical protein